MNPHQIHRTKVELEINILPRQSSAELVEWLNKFFAFYHPNLEARVTSHDKFGAHSTLPGEDLLEEPVNGAELLADPEPDGAELLELPGVELLD